MKFIFSFLFTFCFAALVFCQHNTSVSLRDSVAKILSVAGKHPGVLLTNTSTPSGVIKMQSLPIPQPAYLSNIPRFSSTTKKFTTSTSVASRSTSELCQDTSFASLVGVYNATIYVQSVTQIRDGGLLVSASMYDSTLKPHWSWKSYGLLIKLDSNGNVSWLKQFQDLTPGDYNHFLMYKAFELASGEIICAGFQNSNGTSEVSRTMIYRLTSKGDIIWKNSLKNTIEIFNSRTGTFTWYVENAVEGLNGDVILCGTSNSNWSSGKIETVVRLNNQGKLVWDANFGNHGEDGAYRFGAEGVSVFVQNGEVLLVGLTHGSNNPQTAPAVNFITLDYTNGSFLTKRFFRPQYNDVYGEMGKNFTYWSSECIRLSNGNFLFYGKLLSDLINNTTIKDHFGVIEFDAASLKVVQSYTISSTIKTNYNNNVVHFDASGRGVASILEAFDGYNGNVYFGSFNKGQFRNQRKANYADAGLPGNNGFAFLKDNGYAFVQTYFRPPPAAKSYFEFRKMHDSDTSSLCLGNDTTVFGFLPLNIIEDPRYSFLDDNEVNKMVVLQQEISQTDTISTSSIIPCKQINFCDTVKIHGNPVICGSSPSTIFTAFKNRSCGARVQWTIDLAAIDSFRVLSDTSVKISFKNNNYQGMLFATLGAGACYEEMRDSMPVNVVRLQAKLDLGPDTTLCNQDSLVLHAANNFSSYKWQDGSTDSLLTVTQPGTYWVETSDGCSNRYADTVEISPLNVTVSLGPDRIKCNNDTLHLSAPPGFLSYSWSNNYNISSLTSQNVVVNPVTDTSYYVRAEKIAGCFVYDTLKVRVNKSPSINLGIDRSFCAGDSVVFNAGSGFDHYLWNNSSTLSQIVAKDTATYSVTGITTEGCRSYDTVKVTNVFLTPIVGLDHNNNLCIGTSRVLDAGDFSSYIWSNGSVSRTLTINKIGSYAVEVTDINGCKGRDSTIVTTVLPVPTNFLPDDTLICSYTTLSLQAKAPYPAYLWNTGATSASITTTQPGLFWLQVTDANNCVGKDSIIVEPKDCMKGFYIPTAFTPNADGKNDVFRPMLFGKVKKYEFFIFNRWGQMVFQSTEVTKGWDGMQSAADQQTIAYAWSCSYQFEGEEVKVEKGTVMLVR